jgi:hypothetical protein
MNDTPHGSGVDDPAVGHEGRDIDIRVIVGFGASLVVAGIVICLVVWLLFGFYRHQETSTQVSEYPIAQRGGELRLPPSPRLQLKPREDLKALRRQEDDLLNSYTWVNQQAGAVRIPIWQAMNQVMQQGFPVAGPAAPGTANAPEGSSPAKGPEPPMTR